MDPRPLILIDTGIIGGPGRGIIQLAAFLVRQGADYLICTFKYRAPKSLEFTEELVRLNFNATHISQRAFYDPSPIWQFLRLVQQGRYNIIQSHGYKSHFVALIVSRLLGVPWIAFAHGWTKENRKVSLYHALDMWMLRFAEAVVAVSPPLLECFSSLRGDHRRTHLILNAVQGDNLRRGGGGEKTRKKLVTRENQYLIGCFGRLSFEKGQDVLLRAVAEIDDPNHDVVILFLGDGPERDALQKLSEELGIHEQVIFYPHTSAMPDYYEAIDVLVLPSRSEGLPNVVLEALCFGVPVISTDVGAVSEVITDGETGWIVPPGDAKKLARTISRVLLDKGAREKVAEAGCRSVVEKFSPTTRGQQILHLYQSLLEEEGCCITPSGA